jgi:bacterial leucyl aminopeptidase
MLRSALVLLLSSQFALGSLSRNKQTVFLKFQPTPGTPIANPHGEYVINNEILGALETYSDPVAALISLQPEVATELAQARLLHVVGEQEPEWLTEGDKLRLRRRGKKFIDITEHEEFYTQQVDISSGKACESFFHPLEELLFTLLQISLN